MTNKFEEMKFITNTLKFIGCIIASATAIALIPLWMALMLIYGLFRIGLTLLAEFGFIDKGDFWWAP
jgi:hypothetical protein